MINLFIILFAAAAFADKWRLEPNKMKNIIFGNLKCEYHSNPTNASQIPKPKLVCLKNIDEKFTVQLGASYFKASPNGKFLLGLSDDGLDRYAFWVLNSKGEVMFKRIHLPPPSFGSKNVFYCEMSTTLTKKWYAGEPHPHFVIKDDTLVDVSVRDCHGAIISLRKNVNI